MQFRSRIFDKIRDYYTLSEYIGKYVTLKRVNNEHVGLCPFHHEKSPSFTVNDNKSFYHCFGCGAHGDIIKFVVDYHKYPYKEAMKKLAEQAGIKWEEQYSKKYEQEQKEADQVLEILDFSCKFYQTQLMLEKYDFAKNYLSERKLDNLAIQTFRLGFAPEGNLLIKALEQKGYSLTLAEKSGVVAIKDGRYYDYFRNRLMFPIINSSGKVVAFGGRAFGDAKPKYLNSKETLVFEKRNILYGENYAKEAAYKSGRVVVVEGYIDVISMQMNGFTETVACLGTALSTDHIRHLWGYCKEPVIFLDSDTAGKKASEKLALNMLPYLKPGYSIAFAVNNNAKDPDELLQNSGKDFVNSIITNPVGLAEALFAIESKKLKSNPTPEQKAAFETNLYELASKIPEKTIATNYRSFFRNKIWEFFANKLKRSTKASVTTQVTNIPSFKNINDSLANAEYKLVAYLIENYELLQNEKICNEFSHIEFRNDKLGRIQTILLDEKSNILDNNSPLPIEKKTNYIKIKVSNQGLSDVLDFLCGSNSIFIDKLAINENSAEIFDYNLLNYYTEKLREEYNENVALCTTESALRANYLKEQILGYEYKLRLFYEQLIDN